MHEEREATRTSRFYQYNKHPPSYSSASASSMVWACRFTGTCLNFLKSMATEYLSLNITCRFHTQAVLPPFKGSTLRGAFGHALKKVSCTLRNQDCQSCLLAKTCAYGLIFATERLSGKHMAARPHPYILNPPAEETQRYQAGDFFSFNLVLLGQAANFLPHIVYTVESMGQNGIGAGAKDGAGVFSLVTITTPYPAKNTEHTLYEEAAKTLRPLSEKPSLSLTGTEEDPVKALTIELITPLRLKSDNALRSNIDFPGLIRAALRRMSAIEECYGEGKPKLDYGALLRQAEAVATVQSDVRWREYKRYSNRQKQEMFFGGLTGTLRFQGELAPFMPVLHYCQEVNLGKQTAFGLGRFRLSAAPQKTV